MRPTCKTCPYFETLGGECRKNPPTFVAVQSREGIGGASFWPPTKATNWCGEHPAFKLTEVIDGN